MANTTDPFASSVHGTNPQNLVEKITRNRIYESMRVAAFAALRCSKLAPASSFDTLHLSPLLRRYWKEHCFALSAELLVDKAIELKFYGGSMSENNKPAGGASALVPLPRLGTQGRC